jgi:MinD superfamily P-loop ATPase
VVTSPVTIAVASGKGGTGKTLVATNLAVLLARTGLRVTLADCDVEAPNDHLFFDAHPDRRTVEVPVPESPAEVCPAGCRVCRDTCRFGAIRMLGGRPVVFPDLCHNCGACVDACPSMVLHERHVAVGHTGAGMVRDGLRLMTGQLDVGQSKAPTLIRATRERAGAEGADVVILDSPPGAACSAVATLHGVDFLLLVTEPTAFGLHDLTLMVGLAKELALPMAVVLNRVGTGVVDVAGYCRSEGVSIIAEIPFDREVAACYADGGLLVDGHHLGQQWFSQLWNALRGELTSIGSEVPA